MYSNITVQSRREECHVHENKLVCLSKFWQIIDHYMHMRISLLFYLLFWRCTDINYKATEIAQQTGRENGINIQPLTTDLVSNLVCVNWSWIYSLWIQCCKLNSWKS